MDPRFVVITGTSRGIGRATALRLASAGVSVLAGVRDPEDGKHLERAAPGRITSLVLDVARDDSIEHAAAAVRTIVGSAGLFGLVNNAAGQGRGSPMQYVTRQDLEATFQVTAFGMALTTCALLPLLEVGRGRIVNVGAGRLPMPFLGAAFGAKFALEGMTDVLRIELRRAGIHVSLVEPGMTRWEDPARQLATYDQALDDGLRDVPPDRRGRYELAAARLKELNHRMLRTAAAAETVAATIERALVARRPKARYYCGWQQKTAALLERFTSARTRDAIVGSMVGF